MVRTLLAYLATYLLWGSTFLGIRIAVQAMPPLAMASLRFLLAGLLVCIWLRIRGGGATMPWRRAALTGGLFTLGTHGIISVISQTAPSGSIAVFMATVPLMATGFALFMGERPGLGVWAALTMGLVGVAILSWPGGTVTVVQGIWLLGAALSWTIGSILTQRWGEGLDKAAMAARQMMAGGGLLFVANGLAGEPWIPEWPGWSTVAAIAYLAVGGTIVAYFSYLHLMQRTTLAKASSYTFVNPIVAVVLGWSLGGEGLSSRVLLATPFIVTAVILTLRARDRPRPVLSGPTCSIVNQSPFSSRPG